MKPKNRCRYFGAPYLTDPDESEASDALAMVDLDFVMAMHEVNLAAGELRNFHCLSTIADQARAYLFGPDN